MCFTWLQVTFPFGDTVAVKPGVARVLPSKKSIGLQPAPSKEDRGKCRETGRPCIGCREDSLPVTKNVVLIGFTY